MGDTPWGWSLSPFDKEDEPKDSARALRYFNLNTKELRVAGESCNLTEVKDMVKEIERKLPEEAQIVFGSVNEWDPVLKEWKNDKK